MSTYKECYTIQLSEHINNKPGKLVCINNSVGLLSIYNDSMLLFIFFVVIFTFPDIIIKICVVFA